MSEDFDISQKETGFPLLKSENIASFAPVNKLEILAYAYVIRRNDFCVRQSAEVFITIEIWIFFLKNHMDSLQDECFI